MLERFEGWKTKMWAKKEVAKAKLKRARVILIGEEHYGPGHEILEKHIIQQAKPTIIATEALMEGQVLPADIRRVGLNLAVLEKKVKELEKEYGVKTGFKGFNKIQDENAERVILGMKELLLKIKERAEQAQAQGNEKEFKKHAKRADTLLLAMNAAIEKKGNPAMAIAYKAGLNYNMAPVVGVDSPKKLKQIQALQEDNPKDFRKYQAIRNKTMAKKIAELVQRGHRPVAIMGKMHVDEVARELEKMGIKTHVIRLPSALESAKSTEEIIRKLQQMQEYQNYILNDQWQHTAEF
jgi:hypothetical protein